MYMSVPRRTCVRGKIVRHGVVHVPEEVILDMVTHSFEASLCTVGGKLFKHHQGAFIGCPTLATLCTFFDGH